MHSFNSSKCNKTLWIKLAPQHHTKQLYPAQLLFSYFYVYFQQFHLGPCAREDAGSKQHVPARAMWVYGTEPWECWERHSLHLCRTPLPRCIVWGHLDHVNISRNILLTYCTSGVILIRPVKQWATILYSKGKKVITNITQRPVTSVTFLELRVCLNAKIAPSQ